MSKIDEIRAIAIIILSLLMDGLLYWGYTLGVTDVKYIAPLFIVLPIFFTWVVLNEKRRMRQDKEKLDAWIKKNTFYGGNKFKCYEVWRPNIPFDGCKSQCNACRDKELGIN